MAVSLSQFVAGGAIALVLVVVRSAAKLGAIAAGRAQRLSLRQSVALGVAMAPVSGVAFALAADLHEVSAGVAASAGAIVFSAIAILELLGPLAVQWALARSGKRMSETETAAARRSAFADSRALTLGVELELQIVNTHHYDLTPSAADLLRVLRRAGCRRRQARDHHQHGRDLDDICEDYEDAVAQLRALRDALRAARPGSTSDLRRRHASVPALERAEDLPVAAFSPALGHVRLPVQAVHRLRQHVHIGCPSPTTRSGCCTPVAVRPHLIALSASSLTCRAWTRDSTRRG